MVLVSAQSTLQAHAREFSRRFSAVKVSAALVFLFLILARDQWPGHIRTGELEGPGLWRCSSTAPPIPAVLLGFAYLQREEQMFQFFRF